MAREAHALDGKPACRQRLAEQAHLERRAGEAMHEQDPAIAVTE
jgi:hypothetical protein